MQKNRSVAQSDKGKQKEIISLNVQIKDSIYGLEKKLNDMLQLINREKTHPQKFVDIDVAIHEQTFQGLNKYLNIIKGKEGG